MWSRVSRMVPYVPTPFASSCSGVRFCARQNWIRLLLAQLLCRMGSNSRSLSAIRLTLTVTGNPFAATQSSEDRVPMQYGADRRATAAHLPVHSSVCAPVACLCESAGGCDVDHPVDAELVGDHAELVAPHLLLQRDRDLAAVGRELLV